MRCYCILFLLCTFRPHAQAFVVHWRKQGANRGEAFMFDHRWVILLCGCTLSCLSAGLVVGEEVAVTGIRAVHRHGQTFVTWRDAGEGQAGANYRYSLYRSSEPITQEKLARAQLCYRHVLNNSTKLYGSAFNEKDRLDPEKPYAIIEEGGKPLPAWSGLAVHTVQKPAAAYYAVIATDLELKPLSKIVPGESATTVAVDERPGPIQPIKLYDSKERKSYVAQTSITGTKGLPLQLRLGGSDARGGGAGEWGDYYLFFGTPDMGYRDGLAGVFSVQENRHKDGNQLRIVVRDAVEHPSGKRAMETYWFGYYCVPEGATHTEPRVYRFTERQLLWIVDWTTKRYGADPQRVTVGGNSSGGVGSWNLGLRHGDRFAAFFPIIGRNRGVPAIPLLGKLERDNYALMEDGQTIYYDYVDGPKFVAEHPGDLPFVGWSCGRRDGYATWQENADMVCALTASHHGFAFSWNNGDHGEGGQAMGLINKYYPAEKFRQNESYPAFGNSSIDQQMGDGDPAKGDLVGGINLGFRWQEIVDEADHWSVRISNDLAEGEMTVDVTPRHCQRFQPKPGQMIRWTNSLGATGMTATDENGLVTVAKVTLQPGKETTLALSP